MNNLILIGMPGSGKSSVGKSLARVLQMNFVDADDKLVADTGRSISEIFATDGEEKFRDLESACIAECAKMNNTVISTGGGVVLREKNMKVLAQSGRIIWLNRPIEDIASTNLSDRPLLAKDKDKVYQMFEKREPLYRKYAQITVRNRGSVSSIVAKLLHLIPRHMHLAVIGDPIAHTRSPQIHHAMAAACDLDLYYEACHVKSDEIGTFLKRVYAQEITGFNVTIPHKSAIIPYLTHIDPYAASCGAVNTVVLKSGALYGYNTDGDGIISALARMDADVKGKKVLLLGAGGAALSICKKCLLCGAKQVTVLCRSPYKAQAMQYNGSEREDRVVIDEMTPEIMSRCAADAQILINATPLGMSGIEGDFTDLSFLDALPKSAVACDIVYKPAETTLLKGCKQRGIRCSNGLPMLIYQAIYAFEHFTGLTVDKDAMYDIVLREIGE